MWVYASRTGLIEPGTLTAVESIVPVFPLLIFAISLLVTFWNPALGGKLLWGAFATPFLIHLARTARPAAKMQWEIIDGSYCLENRPMTSGLDQIR
jgi:hypothetical protein